MVFDEQTDLFVPYFYVLLTSKTDQIYRHAYVLGEKYCRKQNHPSKRYVRLRKGTSQRNKNRISFFDHEWVPVSLETGYLS